MILSQRQMSMTSASLSINMLQCKTMDKFVSKRVERSKSSESGQMMIEFGFMLFMMLAPMLVTLLVFYEVINELITVQEQIYYDLREKIDDRAAGPFFPVYKKETARVELPVKMHGFIGVDKVEVDLELRAFAGCWQGNNLNSYKLGRRLRTTGME